ncbi:colicin uptake protein TolR [Candidatus Palibaumannia cicadellinicola]|uniref:Tol biopolymer transport system, TolR protein n=1 Tax=Candidatus Palibaumannia cicadellinicola TaxID=186490 RepID=A0A088NA19_9GAMM|nr:colicin uptake protein TolR [Candidatus Baumannia cicadellinicola]AIN46998.1 Tol biopolymer transport system, TolR protein [Candidatus Baumannia cicadellinicola]
MKINRRRVRREINVDINLVPLLDVLLVLVLVLMATVPMITQSVEVNLPEATNSKTMTSDDIPPVIVEVNGVNQYNLVIAHTRKKQQSAKQVILEVQTLITTNPKTIFLIGGAKEVPYDEIIKALNLLHQAGVKSVGLMTQPSMTTVSS